MKIRLIALAALAAVGSAHALTPLEIEAARGTTLKEIYIAGGSAQRLFVGAWFQEQCDPTTFDVFFDGSGATPSGSSYRAYSCKLKAKLGTYPAKTPVVIYKRDAGGSYQAVGPVATGTAQNFMHVGSGNCTATGTSRPAVDIQGPTYACTTTSFDSIVADAGVSDVEPGMLVNPNNLPSNVTVVPTAAEVSALDRATVNQTIMGVIVNKRAYLALQKTQGLVDMAATSIDESADKMPTLTSGFVASVMAGKASGASATGLGWGSVISSAVDSSVNTRAVNYCRRGVGSGTQASISSALLGVGCLTGPNLLAPAGQTLTTITYNGNSYGASTDASSVSFAAAGAFNVRINSSGGNMITCVGGTAATTGAAADDASAGPTGTSAQGTAGAYAIGLLSRESSPLPTVGSSVGKDLGFRFVKIDGAAPTRDVAKVGGYPLLFNATMQFNKSTLTDAGKKAFVQAMRNGAGTSSKLLAADVDTQQGVLAAPATWTGAYNNSNFTVAEQTFASRADRATGLSCAPLRLTK